MIVYSDYEKPGLFKLHLAETFQPHLDIADIENTNTVNMFLNIPRQPSLPVKFFLPNDAKYLIQKYTLHKSSSYDLITAEVARNLPKKAILHLIHI